jgi:hypothetical protein
LLGRAIAHHHDQARLFKGSGVLLGNVEPIATVAATSVLEAAKRFNFFHTVLPKPGRRSAPR